MIEKASTFERELESDRKINIGGSNSQLSPKKIFLILFFTDIPMAKIKFEILFKFWK